jgi:hypothetical protein
MSRAVSSAPWGLARWCLPVAPTPLGGGCARTTASCPGKCSEHEIPVTSGASTGRWAWGQNGAGRACRARRGENTPRTAMGAADQTAGGGRACEAARLTMAYFWLRIFCIEESV